MRYSRWIVPFPIEDVNAAYEKNAEFHWLSFLEIQTEETKTSKFWVHVWIFCWKLCKTKGFVQKKKPGNQGLFFYRKSLGIQHSLQGNGILFWKSPIYSFLWYESWCIGVTCVKNLRIHYSVFPSHYKLKGYNWKRSMILIRVDYM